MKVHPEQLAAHLSKRTSPVYFISGNEPLLIQEAIDDVRSAAKKMGFSEREVYEVGRGFDWNLVLQSINSPSLFSEKRLLELRIGNAKLGTAGSQMLQTLVQGLPPDVLMLIVSEKIDASAQKTKWFKAIDQVGVFVQIWPVQANQLPAWLTQRMRRVGLQTTPEGVRLLADRIEGNLLAGTQEIEKLHLHFGAASISIEQIQGSVADSARFDIFGLADEALAGKGRQALRVLDGLRGEGVEPILVLWALAREIRGLLPMQRAVEHGTPVSQVLAQYRVWERRKPIISGALQRHTVHDWEDMLLKAGEIDRALKGAGRGNPWDLLARLCLDASC